MLLDELKVYDYIQSGEPATDASVIIVTSLGQHCGGGHRPIILCKDSIFLKTGIESFKTMFSAHLTLFVMALVSATKAAGIGKAWEVSPVQKSDHPAPLSPWPRMDTSPFEVRSISGVGRVAPSEGHHEPFDSERRTYEDKSKDTSTNSEDYLSLEPVTNQPPQFRQSRELEDLETSNVFVPEDLFHDPMVEGFFRKTKQVENVEALPSLWQKIRSQNRAGKNYGHCSEVEEIDEPATHEESESELLQEKPRVRRETEDEMEKIAASNNVREARLNSPESWSKQPLSVEFRHRTNLDEVADKEEKLARSTARGFHAPQADFVTANRRSFSESRESRDLSISPQRPVARSYDEMPTYRNMLRDRDYDAPYSRGLFYPERYRTERDYFVRGLNEPTYPQDRYREVDFDLYGRSRPPMPKPKRIIYYATLPEVVRKPVDLRSYPRTPYDPMTRSSSNVMPQDAYYKRRGNSAVDPGRYRYYSHPYGSNYDNYDMYPKKVSWNDNRSYVPYPERIENARRREPDTDHANMRDASRNEEAMLELGHDRKMPDRVKSRDQEKSPWPVKVGTEVSVKENERDTGRKIFGQLDDYNRFRNNARMDRDREGTGSAEGRD